MKAQNKCETNITSDGRSNRNKKKYFADFFSYGFSLTISCSSSLCLAHTHTCVTFLLVSLFFQLFCEVRFKCVPYLLFDSLPIFLSLSLTLCPSLRLEFYLSNNKSIKYCLFPAFASLSLSLSLRGFLLSFFFVFLCR